jgi:hypothetical protein
MDWTVGGRPRLLGIAIAAPGSSRATDERDRQIGRLGDRAGQSFVVIGAVAAMLMAVAEA